MSKSNGGPAFARPKSPKGEYTDSDVPGAKTGMTLRDYFAAKAMQAILGAGDSYDFGDGMPIAVIPDHAYALADAMIAERAK